MPRDNNGVSRAIAAQRRRLDEAAAGEWMVTDGGMQFFPPTGTDRRAAAKWLAGKELFQFAIARNDEVRILWQPNMLNPAVRQRMEAERAATERRDRELAELLPKILDANATDRNTTKPAVQRDTLHDGPADERPTPRRPLKPQPQAARTQTEID